jgi:hypothetical protein
MGGKGSSNCEGREEIFGEIRITGENRPGDETHLRRKDQGERRKKIGWIKRKRIHPPGLIAKAIGM